MSIQNHSQPSELKITDLRFAIVGHDNWRWPPGLYQSNIREGWIRQAFVMPLNRLENHFNSSGFMDVKEGESAVSRWR